MEMAPHLWTMLGLGTVKVVVEFHPPITLADCGSRKALAEHCEERVAGGIAEALSGRRAPPPQSAPGRPASWTPSRSGPPPPQPRCRDDPAASPPSQVPLTKRLYIKTYGCQMNVYDFGPHGGRCWRPSAIARRRAAEAADLVILNTCHIREKAAEKVFSELGALRRLKKAPARGEAAGMIVAVAGCVAQAEGEEILAPRALRRHRARAADLSPPARDGGAGRARGRRAVLDTDFPAEAEIRSSCPAARGAAGVSAFLTVQEGCDKFCTFCVVPYTRGAEVLAPRGRGARRGRRPGRGGRARDHAARPERQRLSRRGARTGGGEWGLGGLIRALARDPGARAHPLHHLAIRATWTTS